MSVRLISETATTVTIGWDPVQGQEGFIPTIDGSETLADGKRHASTSRTQTSVPITKPNDGKPHSYGVDVLGTIMAGAVTVPQPPAPPSVLTPHAPLNLTSGSGFTLQDFLIDASALPTGTRAVLLNGGPVKNTSLIHGELRGNRLCHIYGGNPAVWPDGVLLQDLVTHSMYEDLWHIDGGRNIHFLRGKHHQDAAYVPAAGAHCDGIQAEAGDSITVEDTFFTWPCSPRRDAQQGFPFGGDAIFFASQAKVVSNAHLIRINVQDWFAGRAVQMLGVSGTIDSPTIGEAGLPTSPKITLSRPVDGGKIVLIPGAGDWASGVVPRSYFAFNDWTGAGWPDYVTVQS